MKNTDVKKKSITLEISNTQSISDAKEYIIQEYVGTLVVLDRKKHIYYSEKSEKCALTIEDNKARIVKMPSGSSMVFEKGKEYITSYFTPHGRLEMAVYTEDYLDRTDTQGILDVSYRLSVSGTQPLYNKMKIKIKEI